MPGEEREEGASFKEGEAGGGSVQCLINGAGVGAACGQAGIEVGEGTHVWGTGPSCHRDTPHRQPCSTASPWSRPSGGQLMGAEEAKVTQSDWDPEWFFPSSMASRFLTIIGCLGTKSRKECVVEASKGHMPERRVGVRGRRQDWGDGDGTALEEGNEWTLGEGVQKKKKERKK